MTTPTAPPNSSKPTTGEVVAAVYNLNPPTLLDGQATPLQVDVNGNLKTTTGGGGGTSNINITEVAGNTVPATTAAALPVELFDGTNPLGVSGNPLYVTQQGSLPSDLIVSGTISANAANVAISTQGADGLVFNVTGTWSGTLQPQYQLPDGSWANGSVFPTLPSGASVSTITGNGQWKTEVGGFKGFRLLSTAWVSGTATINLEAAHASTFVAALIKGSTGLAMDAATGNTAPASTLQVGGSDGTNIRSFLTDTNGQLNVLAGNLARSTASWTSSTAQNTTLQVSCLGYTSAIVTFSGTGTVTPGVATFEASDTAAFTNAYTLLGNAIQSGQGIVSTVAFATSNTSYTLNVAGWTAFRLRLSTAITGGGTEVVSITLSSAPNPFIVGQVSNLAGGSVGARSTTTGSIIADNNTASTHFQSSAAVNGPLDVCNWAYGGAFSGSANAALQGWSKARTPTVFKTASVSAGTTGNSAIWTPGTGNKFRLLGFQITAQGLAATATAAITVSFQDASTGINIGTYDVDVPAVANVVSGVTQISGGAVNLGSFGVLSAAANNALNFNISAAGSGTVGTYRVTVWGTEE